MTNARPSAQTRHDARPRGFSLVELCVTLAVCGVLATIALPSFLDQLARSRRADATSSLQRLQWTQERYRRDHGRYAERLDQLGGTGHSTEGHYRLELRANGPDGYEALAWAEPSQLRDRACPVLGLQVRGEISHYQPGSACWKL